MSNNYSKAQPVAEADRIRSVDILRGVALLGILMMNIPYFALPERFADAFRQDLHSASFWTKAVIDVLFEGKMRALFSAIFGAGILLFVMRKEQAGQPFKALFFRRMGWLVLFGLIHAHLLLWLGDILYFYGLIGMLAFLFRRMKAKYLALGVPLVAILSFVSSTLFYQSIRNQRIDYLAVVALQKQHKPLNTQQKKAIADWNASAKEFFPNQALIAKNTALMKSGYQEVASYVRPFAWDQETKYLFFQIGDILALMLLGMALYKWNFLSGGWSGRQYMQTALIGYGIGLPLVLFNVYYSYLIPPGISGFKSFMVAHSFLWTDLVYPFQRILLMMAHASVILLILRAGFWKGLNNRLAAVGQMAFTNYIMHTIICTLFFYGYGLNRYAELEYYQLYYVVGLIWIFQLIISPLWLKYFLFGPLEWLWRSLTYWQLQPMRRRNEISSVSFS